MNIEELKKMAQDHEIRIDSHEHYQRTPPYYYDSLRHAFEFYFNTFHTKNAMYNFYAQGLSEDFVSVANSHQLLDEDNTVQSIVAFERFFELFIKDILWSVDEEFVNGHGKLKGNKIQAIISKIRDREIDSNKNTKRVLVASFSECIDRFYDLIKLSKLDSQEEVVVKFRKILSQYDFLQSPSVKISLELINWYRSKILHNGSNLPSPWFLDYMITQKIIPIVKLIVEADKDKIGDAKFYFETLAGHDLLNLFSKITYELEDLKDYSKAQIIFNKLLNIGHLKELGRANLNMNLYIRNYNKATNEYNYYDSTGRAKRFAEAERQHKDFKVIKKCVCCCEETLVVYRLVIEDPFNPGNKQNIDWLKCYLCDYHLRYNTGEPVLFELSQESFFE